MSYQRILEGAPGGENFAPDAIAMAKSLGAGYPIGAVWIREPYQDVFGPGSHGTTYGGSPLACAVALTVLDVVEREKLAENIRARGDELKKGLEALIGTRGMKAVNGMGGLLGLVVEDEPAKVVARLTAAGLILIPAANQAVRFLPPLNVTAEEIAEALRIVEENPLKRSAATAIRASPAPCKSGRRRRRRRRYSFWTLSQPPKSSPTVKSLIAGNWLAYFASTALSRGR